MAKYYATDRRLRSGLSYLQENELKHSFQESINPLCNCGHEVESTVNIYLPPPFFALK